MVIQGFWGVAHSDSFAISDPTRNFRLVMPQGKSGHLFCTREQIGLDSWTSLIDYLEEAWREVLVNEDPPDQWLAAAVFANSD